MNFKSTRTEEHVEAHLVKRVKDIGGFSLKGDRTDGRRFIDRICILPGGVTLYVECKRPRNGRYSAHQIETLRRLKELGQHVERVKNVDEVNTLLTRFGG